MVMPNQGKNNSALNDTISVILSSDSSLIKNTFVCCPTAEDKFKYFNSYKQALTQDNGGKEELSLVY